MSPPRFSDYLVGMTLTGNVIRQSSALDGIGPFCVTVNTDDYGEALEELRKAGKKHLCTHIGELLSPRDRAYSRIGDDVMKADKDAGVVSLDNKERELNAWQKAIVTIEINGPFVVWLDQKPPVSIEGPESVETMQGNTRQSGSKTAIRMENWPTVARLMDKRNGRDCL